MGIRFSVLVLTALAVAPAPVLATDELVARTGRENASPIRLDGLGKSVTAGTTLSADFPLKDAYDATCGFMENVLIVKIEHYLPEVKKKKESGPWWLRDWWNSLLRWLTKK